MIAVFLSALCSWLFLALLIPLLRRRLLDLPNARSSHSQPTPCGGGVSFVLVAFVSSLFALSFGDVSTFSVLPLLVTPLAIVGLLDDCFNLPSSLRYVVQLFTALIVLVFTFFVPGTAFCLTLGSFSILLFLVFMLMTFTAVINFINFMDGLDGLVAGCMVVALSSGALQLSASWPIWSLVGGLLGFLWWNWSPAKVFMGDAGSTFLGAMFAGLVIQSSSLLEALGLLLVSTPLMADACLCVLRRLMTGQRVFQAHRLHLFQRLHQAGWPHPRVSSLYITATAVLAVSLLWGGLAWVIALAALELFFGIWLDQRVAVPFSVASRS